MMKEVTKELINLGHTKILFLNAASSMTVSSVREKGFKKQLLESSIPPEDSCILYKDNKEQESSEYGYDAIMEHFQTLRYTAVIADMDKVAVGAAKALKKLNYQIPQDVSLVALSNDLILSRDMEPPLATVDMHSVDLGKESVRLLFAKLGIGEFEPADYKIVPASYEPRASCGPAKGKT
jgi:DNA-binding LacI/PurR family transcriptional regulator